MSKGNKNSRVGFGMKPRGVQENQVDESVEPIEEQEEVSVDEGQQDAPEKVELDGLEGPLDSSTLETENVAAGNVPSVPLEGMLSDDNPSLPSDYLGIERSSDAAAKLEELMKVAEPIKFDLSRLTADNIDKFKANIENSGPIRAATLEEITAITGIKQAEWEAAHPTEEAPEQRRGERGDGTFGMVVSIPEGYIDIIRDQAESDGITPEAWMNIRVQEIMDQWWQVPKGR